MLFSSFTFLCFFLPIVLGVYYVLPGQLRNLFLLLASLVFYAFGEPVYVFLMMGVVLFVYGISLSFSLCRSDLMKQIVLVFGIALVLGILFYFKYFDFSISTFNQIFTTEYSLVKVIMPIGISFYIFQALSYLIDVYRKTVPVQKNPLSLMLYIGLFPQLIAGPIVRYNSIYLQLYHRRHSVERVYAGFCRFVIGLGKKVIIANTLGITVDRIFSTPVESLSPAVAWTGMIFYTLQLYFDFSGYSDMAIGLGRMFGFKFLENFNYPYISRSVSEFWRRWHMSLSGWFKQYVYISLGGNRKGLPRTVINLFIVFLLTGIWHGAAWTFILWGIWHGSFIVAEKIISAVCRVPEIIRKYAGHVYLLLVVMAGWVLFRSETIGYATDYLKMLTGFMPSRPDFGLGYYVRPGGLVIMGIGVFAAFGGFKKIHQLLSPYKIGRILESAYVTAVLCGVVILLTASSYNPFIYFRF